MTITSANDIQPRDIVEITSDLDYLDHGRKGTRFEVEDEATGKEWVADVRVTQLTESGM